MSEKTFGQRADDYANNASGQPWFDAREAHLSELLTAFWLGEFEDENGGNAQLSIKITSNYRGKSDPATRRLVLRGLPISAPWMPEEIRRSSQEPPPYHALAAMRARQYDPAYLFNLLERISIPDDTYRPWLRSRQIALQTQNQPNQPSEQETKHQIARKHDREEDAQRKIKIKKVLALARRDYPDPKRRPGIRPMATELVRKHRDTLGFKDSAVRKILAGSYPLSKRLEIPGL